MNSKIKVGIYALLLTIVIVSSIATYITLTKPATVDISKNENVDIMPLEELVGMFNDDEEKANAALIDKVIEVKGLIKEISFLNNRHTIILNEENFTHSFVICDMSPTKNYDINKFIVGDTIILRGVCKGYLLDVIMLNCIPINENTN